MPKPDSLQGSLALLVLKILSRRPRLHGYAIMSAIQDMSSEVLRVEEGSLYPRSHRRPGTQHGVSAIHRVAALRSQAHRPEHSGASIGDNPPGPDRRKRPDLSFLRCRQHRDDVRYSNPQPAAKMTRSEYRVRVCCMIRRTV